jgi:hypothetical protein
MNSQQNINLKNQNNLGEPPKHELISKTLNLWNFSLGFNQEVQFQTNLMLKNKTDFFKTLPKWEK